MKQQINLWISTAVVEELDRRCQAQAMTRPQLVTQWLTDDSLLDRLIRVEVTFDRLAEANPALAKIWGDAAHATQR